MSDDPLSRNTYMTMGYASGCDREGIFWRTR